MSDAAVEQGTIQTGMQTPEQMAKVLMDVYTRVKALEATIDDDTAPLENKVDAVRELTELSKTVLDPLEASIQNHLAAMDPKTPHSSELCNALGQAAGLGRNFTPRNNGQRAVGLKVQRLDSCFELPKYQLEGDAGLDVYSSETLEIQPGAVAKVPLGFRCQFPQGYVMLMFPRSGKATKERLSLANNVGVIEHTYRGEVMAPVENRGEETRTIQRGDRVAQIMLMPIPRVSVIQVQDLDSTERGAGGFGHTD